eukprot:CAMPEP_0115352392 /NCGR_PEP_ID=MMETSP0270-20121206/97478_1 /TAXON_ID=71861 /ORGANISM="Scrippsiella trochoidea, Strain CCMP3099" /LENGTH=91 /DNA_ID=CAMNT_0002774555 /DNA_START=150 /DNA_END=425 /DNA_ORIENTATION=-
MKVIATDGKTFASSGVRPLQKPRAPSACQIWAASLTHPRRGRFGPMLITCKRRRNTSIGNVKVEPAMPERPPAMKDVAIGGPSDQRSHKVL